MSCLLSHLSTCANFLKENVRRCYQYLLGTFTRRHLISCCVWVHQTELRIITENRIKKPDRCQEKFLSLFFKLFFSLLLSSSQFKQICSLNDWNLLWQPFIDPMLSFFVHKWAWCATIILLFFYAIDWNYIEKGRIIAFSLDLYSLSNETG